MPKRLLHLIALGAVLLLRPGEVFAEGKPDGAALYKTECTRCHGSQGQGTKRSKKKLEGDLSVAQLADLVRKTMPEDDPGSLSPEKATAVASFIHAAFYSSLARERDRPAHIELARLTVGQYRQAVADVVGTFRPQAKGGGTNGLRGEYFKGRGFRPPDRVLERTDPQVNFDFGTASAVPGKAEPHAFSIRWSGSLLAPETGEYQFVVRTQHAARLWVNDKKVPLIDAWVNLRLGAGDDHFQRVEPGRHERGPGDDRVCRVAPGRSVREPGERPGSPRETPLIRSRLRGAGLSSAADRRAEDDPRTAVRGDEGAGVGFRAGGPLRPRVALVLVPGGRPDA